MERRIYKINGSVTPSGNPKAHVGSTSHYVEKETAKGYALQQEYPEANEPLTTLKKEAVGVVEVHPHLFADGTFAFYATLWVEDEREGKLKMLRHLQKVVSDLTTYARMGRDAVMDLIDELTDSPEVL